MKTRQVFKSYTTAIESVKNNTKFCPLCGTGCSLKPDNGIMRMTCPKCGYIFYRNPAPAVSVLITDNSKFLLCRRAVNNYQGGKWCLPCGFIEFDEDFLTAAIREVKEETGLIIEIQSIISVVSNFFNPDLHTLVIVLLAKPTGGELGIGDPENDQLQWFSGNEALPEMAFESDTYIINRFFNNNLTGIPVDRDYSNQ